jgi:ABC-type oligopeptide transport system ATPase subunit
MKIITEELPNEMKQGKAIEEWRGDLTFKTHETSITWKTLSSIRTIDQAQEEFLHLGEKEGEEDPRKFKIMTQKIHTSISNIMEEAVAPKRAQKLRRT